MQNMNDDKDRQLNQLNNNKNDLFKKFTQQINQENSGFINNSIYF